MFRLERECGVKTWRQCRRLELDVHFERARLQQNGQPVDPDWSGQFDRTFEMEAQRK